MTADSARSEQVSLSTRVGTVHGTLLVPAVSGRMPVVLLISGSGPTDRDGNTPLVPGGGPASLRLMAEALAQHGIASLRYDKRGIAASTISPADIRAVRFDDFVSDAAAWVEKLRADARFSRVVIAGHSEGALIGTIAAQKFTDVPLITLEGAGKRASEVIHDQLANAPPALAAQADGIMAALVAGRTVDSVPAPLMGLFGPQVQQYEISWFRYDPATELTKVRTPVLIVQGTNDVQVSLANAQRLEASTRAHGRLVVIDSMTHNLKFGGPDQESQVRTYTDSTLPIVPALVDAVVAFVHAPGDFGTPKRANGARE
jgi:alpha-beta hydrolase superfamily lysophospholipase